MRKKQSPAQKKQSPAKKKLSPAQKAFIEIDLIEIEKALQNEVDLTSLYKLNDEIFNCFDLLIYYDIHSADDTYLLKALKLLHKYNKLPLAQDSFNHFRGWHLVHLLTFYHKRESLRWLLATFPEISPDMLVDTVSTVSDNKSCWELAFILEGTEDGAICDTLSILHKPREGITHLIPAGTSKSKQWHGANLLHLAAFHLLPRTIIWLSASSGGAFDPLQTVDCPSDNIYHQTNCFDLVTLKADCTDVQALKVTQALFCVKKQFPPRSKYFHGEGWTIVHHNLNLGMYNTTDYLLKQSSKDFLFDPDEAINFRHDEGERLQNAWGMLFESAHHTDESCLKFLRLLCSHKFKIPQKLIGTQFDGLGLVHLAISFLLPKSLAWLLKQEIGFDALEILKGNLFNQFTATNMLFFIDSADQGEGHTKVWEVLLQSNKFNLELLLDAYAIYCESAFTDKKPHTTLLLPFLRSIDNVLPKDLPLKKEQLAKIYACVSRITTVRKTLVDTKTEFLGCVARVLLGHAMVDATLSFKTAIGQYNSERNKQENQKAQQKKELILAKKIAKFNYLLSDLNNFIEPLNINPWTQNGLTFSLVLPDQITYKDITLSCAQFRSRLRKHLAELDFDLPGADEQSVIIRAHSNQRPLNQETFLKRIFVREEPKVAVPVSQLKVFTREKPKVTAPVSQLVEKENISSVKKSSASHCELDHRESWRRREEWVSKGAPFLKGGEPDIYLKSFKKRKPSKVKPDDTDSDDEVMAVRPKSVQKKKASPAKKQTEKSPESKPVVKLFYAKKTTPQDPRWIKYKCGQYQKAVDLCLVIRNAVDEHKDKGVGVLEEACKEIQACFNPFELILGYNQAYCVMKISTMLSYISKKDIKNRNPEDMTLTPPIHHQKFKLIRDSLCHPENPFQYVSSKNLFDLAVQFETQLIQPLQHFVTYAFFEANFYHTELKFSEDLLPKIRNKEVPPKIDVLLSCLQRQFIHLQIFDLVARKIKEMQFNLDISYFHNAIKTSIMLIGQALKDLKSQRFEVYERIMLIFRTNAELICNNNKGGQFSIFEALLLRTNHQVKDDSEDYVYFEDILPGELLGLLANIAAINEALSSSIKHEISLYAQEQMRIREQLRGNVTAVAFTPKRERIRGQLRANVAAEPFIPQKNSKG